MEENNNKENETKTPVVETETPVVEADTETPTSEPTPTPVSTPTPEMTPLPGAETPVAEEGAPTTGATRNMILGIVLGIAVIVGGYYIMQGVEREPLAEVQPGVTQIDPNAEVARVNGVPIYGAALSFQMVQAAQAAGVPLNAIDPQNLAALTQQSLDAVVNTELIVQAAEALNIEVTQEEVDSEFSTLAAQIGGEEVALARLAELGTSLEDFKGNLFNDILIRKYLETNTNQDDLVVSEEEIEDFYAQVTAGNTEGMPTLEEARVQIVERLKFDKQQAALLGHLEELRAGANIEILN